MIFLNWINRNYDKILHLTMSYMLFSMSLKISSSIAFNALGVLFLGLIWEVSRKRLYGTAVSNKDMMFNLIGVLLAIIIKII